MSHKHRNILQAIFHDPIAGNIHWREVESLLHHLGAGIESAHGARFRVVLNRHEFTVHYPHHGSDMGRNDIRYLREHLSAAGVSLSSYEAAEKQ